MNSRLHPFILSLVMLCIPVAAKAQDLDKELSTLAEKLAGSIKESAKKKLAVLDFTDLKGTQSELGKYIAEQLTVNLVIAKRDFAVLDRANLQKILAEHSLTAKGLIDPKNAKQLGMFAGVDALILGVIIPKGENMDLTAKIISTETAEIVGAARASFKPDATVQQLATQAAPEVKPAAASDAPPEPAKIVKSFDDLRVELEQLQIVNGGEYLLRMTLSNPMKKPIHVAAVASNNGELKAVLTNSDGTEFYADNDTLSGLVTDHLDYQGEFDTATEIKPGDSVAATVKFQLRNARSAPPGRCNLQFAFIVGSDWRNDAGHGTTRNLITKIEAK
jgi:TolB-like protein